MKVTRQHLQIAILVLGGILILYGLLKILFHISFGVWVEQNLPTGIMIGAAVIFVWNRQLWNDEQKKKAEEARKAEEAGKTAEPEDPPGPV